MTYEEAVKIVATKALGDLVENKLPDEWESYPEIGENDWERVTDEARGIAGTVPTGEYDEAYKFLAERAA
jgi:hypothetical protein